MEIVSDLLAENRLPNKVEAYTYGIVLLLLNRWIKRYLQNEFALFDIVTHKHRYQTIAIQEIEHCCLIHVDHLLSQLFRTKVNIDKVLHIFHALLLNSQLCSNLAVYPVSCNQILARNNLSLFGFVILGSYLNLVMHSFHAGVPRIILYILRINPVMQLFGKPVLTKVIWVGVGESANVLQYPLSSLCILQTRVYQLDV